MLDGLPEAGLLRRQSSPCPHQRSELLVTPDGVHGWSAVVEFLVSSFGQGF